MAKFDVDEDLVRKLANLMDDTGLSEIEYRSGEQVLRVARGGGIMTVGALPPPVSGEAPSSQAPAESGPHPGAVTAPMVGVVYLGPEPGSPPFIKPGDVVTEGQTLLLIEAMKTFNPVRAPRAGRIDRILVTDKIPVEFGEELVIIE